MRNYKHILTDIERKYLVPATNFMPIQKRNKQTFITISCSVNSDSQQSNANRKGVQNIRKSHFFLINIALVDEENNQS